MAGRDAPALAVRCPRAHSPLQHGAREPDARDHPDDRPPRVAGPRTSMRSAARCAHSRSSRMLRRAQLGRLLVVGAPCRKKVCALQSPHPRYPIARAPGPPRATPSAQPSVRAPPQRQQICASWKALRGDGQADTGASPATTRELSLPRARRTRARTPSRLRCAPLALITLARLRPGLRRSAAVPDRPTAELEGQSQPSWCAAAPHACRPPARHARPTQAPHAATARAPASQALRARSSCRRS